MVAAARAQAVDEVIVVDNGSSDATAAVAAAAGAVVVVEPRHGYGYACMAGSAAAHGDILVYLDGDGSFLPAEMPRLIEPLCADVADLVLGSRVLGHIAAGAMPPHQRTGNWLAASLMRGLYRVQVTDLGPYRAIRRDLLGELDMLRDDVRLAHGDDGEGGPTGARIHEVPVSCLARTWGRSKVGGNLRGSMLAAYRILSVTLRYAR